MINIRGRFGKKNDNSNKNEKQVSGTDFEEINIDEIDELPVSKQLAENTKQENNEGTNEPEEKEVDYVEEVKKITNETPNSIVESVQKASLKKIVDSETPPAPRFSEEKIEEGSDLDVLYREARTIKNEPEENEIDLNALSNQANQGKNESENKDTTIHGYRAPTTAYSLKKIPFEPKHQHVGADSIQQQISDMESQGKSPKPDPPTKTPNITDTKNERDERVLPPKSSESIAPAKQFSKLNSENESVKTKSHSLVTELDSLKAELRTSNSESGTAKQERDLMIIEMKYLKLELESIKKEKEMIVDEIDRKSVV